VVTRFEARVDGYLAGVAKMQSATAGFAKSAETHVGKHKGDFDKIGKAAMVGGAAIAVGIGYAAKSYMEFEASMSKVAAVADATARQQEALSKAAIKAGQDTVFSATEAAAAEAELAKAGVSVDNILGGALTGSLNLAAAGQIDLADSAEIAAQAMNIFKLEGSDVGHIADVLTAGANKSAAGVDDLGMALKQGGLVAAQTGLSLEDTVGALSAFADNALKGSDAGTSLKTMLQRLNPQSTEAAALMDELGLRAYDSQGNFVGLAEYAGQLQQALGGMSAEQRNAALSTIFGSDAIRAASILMEQGEAGVRKYVAAVDDQGAAARMAARQTDNLKGDIERLKGTLESAFINAGSGGNAGLRSLVQGITGAVDAFNKLSPEAQSAAVQVAAVSAAALLVGGAGIKATTSILAMKAAMEGAGAAGARLATVLKTVGAGVVVAAVAGVANELVSMQAKAEIADVSVKDLAASLGQLGKSGNLSGGIADLFRRDGGLFSSQEKIVTTADAVSRFASVANDALGDSLYSKFVRLQDMGEGAAQLEKYVSSLDGALADMVRAGNADQAKAALDRMLSGIKDQGVVDEVRGKFEQYQAALDETAVAGASATDGAKDVASATDGAASSAKAAADATKAWADELAGIANPLLDARSAARDFEQAIDDASAALKDNGKTLDITSEKGRNNQAALDGVAKAAVAQITAMQANGASQGELQAKLSSSRASLQATAEKFRMSKATAEAFADQVLKVPTQHTTNLTANTGGAVQSVSVLTRTVNGVPTYKTITIGASTAQAMSAIGTLQYRINGLNGKTVTITTRYVTEGRRAGSMAMTGGLTRAEGGPVYGPGSGTSDSVPALLSNGEHVWTADEVARVGGHGAMYRARAAAKAGALKFAEGGAVPRFAGGGEVDYAAMMAILRDVTSWDDYAAASRNLKDRMDAVKTYQQGLKGYADRERKIRDAVLKLQAKYRTADAKNRAAIAKQVAAYRAEMAAIDRQQASYTKAEAWAKGQVAPARSAAAAAYAEYKVDARPMIDRALTAAGRSNTVTKAFLDNIDRLVKMGFKPLAMELLNQGGPEAEDIAAQAVKSAAKAKQLQTQFATSASLSARAAALKAALNGDLPELAAVATALAKYEQVRDLSGVVRSGMGMGGITVNVQTGVGDPVAIGAAVERVLLTYRNVTGSTVRA
jgi:TP901 family phage tail tape measure protein